MSGPAPDSIIRQIAKLGPRHLVTETIMEHYNRKPILLYISFWDDRSLDFRGTNPRPRNRYGALSNRKTRCIVENYETAFAFLLASHTTKKLAETERKPRAALASNDGDLISSYPLYEIDEADGQSKPIDYHFLHNFHTTNVRNVEIQNPFFVFYPSVAPPQPPPDPDPDPEPIWWPNIVVRLSELAAAMATWRLPAGGRSEWKSRYRSLFGILAPAHVRLQGYFILINGAFEDARTLERYEAFRVDETDKGDAMYRSLVQEYVKSYDVTNRLPGDITSASPADFRGLRYDQAKLVEWCFSKWDHLESVTPLDAFFVRWKTGEQLCEERRRLDGLLDGTAQTESGESVTVDEGTSLRRCPVRGFSERHRRYLRNEEQV
ncbi:hypothetical protein F4861DRAFT_98778 [Xylaria intraflava]|nr:hypothetical protein F4861DRAFT_98778 [Xylaria intraflava]